MIKEKIKVNNRHYEVTFDEQTHMYAARLRRLYQQSYSDMDSFDEVSSEISNTVNNLLKHAVSPEVREDDMDGLIQQLLKMYEKTTKK
jgi:deoxyadenosine/deoxycytidine kinase